jgi:hypothetical protein
MLPTSTISETPRRGYLDADAGICLAPHSTDFCRLFSRIRARLFLELGAIIDQLRQDQLRQD